MLFAAVRKEASVDTVIKLRSYGFGVGHTTFCNICALSDVLLIVASFVCSYGLIQAFLPQHFVSKSPDFALQSGLFFGVSYILMNFSSKLYTIVMLQNKYRSVFRVSVHAFISLLILETLLFVAKSGPDTLLFVLLLFFPSALIAVVINRFATTNAVCRLLEAGLIVGPRVVLIGDETELAHLPATDLMSDFGLMEVGRIALAEDAAEDRCRNAVEKALSLSRHAHVEKFVLAVKWGDVTRLSILRGMLQRSALPVLLVPDATVRKLSGECAERKGRFESVPITLQKAPTRIETLIVKRLLDILLSGFAICLLSPLMVFSAIAIKMDSPGPVIFRQKRHGFDRRPFWILKFRSMTVMDNGSEIVQASRGDTRITRVGAVLRKTSIDELPQLFNVLLGQMSLVGPRPHAVAHDDAYSKIIECYSLRHHVKPGITGWAQVNGARGRTEAVPQMQARVEYDLWYIDNCSIWLDLVILARTCFTVLQHDAF